MIAVFWLIDAILSLVWWLIVASAVFSWLIAFNVINMSNGFVAQVASFLWQMTEPILRPVRRVIPNLGAIDISPIVVLLGIQFLQIFLRTSIYPAVARALA